MSERKVLSKYYPADFDPSSIKRSGKKKTGPSLQLVRLMAPVSMRCTRCGEYIYKGRKFNARKETPVDKYVGVQIYRFYIRCTRCSGEIIFRTDPKNQDYSIVSGAKRNIEPWDRKVEETDEQRLDRLEMEEAAENGEAAEEQNRMEELEAKTLEARREMEVADALDEIRTRNARLARADHRDHLEAVVRARPTDEEERLRQQDLEDAEAARQAFTAAQLELEVEEVVEEEEGEPSGSSKSKDPLTSSSTPAASHDAASTLTPASEMNFAAPSFKRQIKKKKDHAALLGIKKKPSLV